MKPRAKLLWWTLAAVLALVLGWVGCRTTPARKPSAPVKQPPTPPGLVLKRQVGQREKQALRQLVPPVPAFEVGPGFKITNAVPSNGQIVLGWQGGEPPFRVEESSTPNGPWFLAGVTSNRTFTANVLAQCFFRVSYPVATPTQTNWAKGFGGTSYNYGQAVAVDSSGNVVMAGTFAGATDFGSGTLTSAGAIDLVVAKYSPGGTCLWSRRFGSTGSEMPKAVAVDGSGIVVAGYYVGTGDAGAGTLTNAGQNDIFVGKYSSADGAPIWTKRFGGPGDDVCNSLALDSSGNIILGGNFSGTCVWNADGTISGGCRFGTNLLCSLYGLASAFAVKLSGNDGGVIWARDFSTQGQSRGNGVATDGGGNLVIVGSVQGSINFGGGALTTGTAFGAYAAKLSGLDGSYVWGKLFGGQSSYGDKGVAVATDTAGNALFTGSFASPSLDFGGGHTVSNPTTQDAVFAAKLASANGACVWATNSFSAKGSASPMAIASDGSNAILTGVYPYNVRFGSTTLNSLAPDTQDVFIARISSGGAWLSASRFGGTTTSDYIGSNAIATDGTNTVTTGVFLGRVNVGAFTLTNHTSYDVFLAKSAP